MLSPPGLTWPEEALSWVVLRLPGPTQPEEVFVEGRWGSCPGPAQPEGRSVEGDQAQDPRGQKRLLLGGTQAGYLCGQRGPQGLGVKAQDTSRLAGTQVSGGDTGRVPLQSPDPLKAPLHPH